MSWKLPPIPELLRAVDAYLRTAYDGELPSAVSGRIHTLQALGPGEFYDSPVFERTPADAPHRLALRLGSRAYPHMKLAIDRSPDGKGYLFRVDTHDRHCCPKPGTRYHDEFCKLMEANQKLAQAIEARWARENLPTFKTYLRADLKRRRAGSG